MKQLSIKLKLTLWFTAIMTVMVAAVLFILLSASNYVIASESQKTLLKVTASARTEIEFEEGIIEIDDDLDTVSDGVSLEVFDKSGKSLCGQLPEGLSELPFKSELMRTAKSKNNAYYVYDLEYTLQDYGPVVLRGVLEADTNDTFSVITRLALIALPFLVIFAALVGYILTRHAFKPVKQICEAAERIENGRDLTSRINLGKGSDEIYTLANTFDKMFDRLQSSFENEKQFTSDASHELRTPISVIISQCEYALEQPEITQEARTAIEAVLQQAKKMSALISQLLMLSRADSGQNKLNLELLNLSELTEIIAAQAGDMAKDKNISVTTDIAPGVLIRGDETMLMRMLLNLTDNAVKYGKQGGRVDIKLYQKDGRIIGEVADDGIGIAPEALPRIWERFYQADEARTSTNEGYGLGLSMVKYIVEAHNGNIEVSSTIKTGTRFRFSLPS